MSAVRRRAVHAFAMVLGVVVLVACGVPLDEADRPLQRERVANVPDDTVAPTTSSPPTSAGAPTTTTSPPYVVDVFWVLGDRLVRVPRLLPSQPDLPTMLEVLVAGPDPSEAQAGFRSALPDAALIRSASLRAGTATMELDPAFLTLPGTEQIFAFAEIVYAVTVVPGVGQVRFQIDGVPIVVPSSDGRPLQEPVSRDDYTSLTGSPVTTSSTTTTTTTTTTTSTTAPRRRGR